MKRGLLVCIFVTGCGGTADVAGTYTVSTTSEANTCQLMGWEEGDTATNIEVVIAQTDSQATAEGRGLGGGLLQLWLGSRTLAGEVSGSGVDLTLIGTNDLSAPGCTYTMNAVLDAEVDGDVLQGELRYQPQPKEGTCGILESCENIQRINGTRPPSIE